MAELRAVAFAFSEIGCVGLDALAHNGFSVQLLVTHKHSSGENVWYRLPEDWARRRGIRTMIAEQHDPASIRLAVERALPDFIFSFMYRHLLPDDILKLAAYAAYNLHPSLLPAYRGRAPINWVLVNGEPRTGVTLHKMERKADAGDIAGQASVEISTVDTALTLHNRIAEVSASLLAELLPKIADGSIQHTPQDLTTGSYFGRRTPDDGAIEWERGALPVYNLIRAVTRPWPGAFRRLMPDRKLFVWWAEPLPTGLPAGHLTTIAAHSVVGCGTGSLRLLEVELDGATASGPDIPAFLAENGLEKL